MLFVVVAFAVFMIAIGAVGLAAPAKLTDSLRRSQLFDRLWGVGAIRIVFGAALIAVAEGTRAPLAFQLFGVLALLAGVATPLVGRERANRMLEWWERQPPEFVRSWCSVVVVIGVLLLYGVAP